jgi:hypothetical protein
MKTERWLTLDILKAIFLVLMIFGHTIVWWYFEADTYLAHPNQFVFAFVVPFIQINAYLMFMFPMIAGCALRMQIENKRLFELIKRGLFVLSMGYLINFRSWDVLQLIGAGIVLISIVEKTVKKFSLVVLTGIAIFVIGSAQQFNEAFVSYDQTYWKPVLFGNKSGKFYFPIFPFISVIIFGYVFQSLQIWAARLGQISRLWTACFVVGVWAIFVSFLSGTLIIPVDTQNVWGPEVFFPPTTRVIAHLGAFLIVVPLADLIVRSAGIGKLKANGWIQVFSKNILYIYTAQYLFAEWFIDRLKSMDHVIFLFVGLGIQMILAYGIGLNIEYLKHGKNFKTRWSWL